MKQAANYIVFQAYGNKNNLYECAYALLSLSRLYEKGTLNDIEIWIYTDQADWFRSFKECWLPLHYREIDAALIKQWRGAIDFVHRVKIEILQDFIKRKQGNILYLDSDICFINKIEKVFANIAAGRLYMHVMEGLVADESDAIFRKLNNFLKKNPVNIEGTDVVVPAHIAMWNAGVLGFNTNKRHVLDEAMKFTDHVYKSFPKHIVEQFAFSLYFQNTGNILTAAPYILHYWNLKEASLLLASFFDHFHNCDWNDLSLYSSLIQMHVIMQDKVSFLQNRTIMGKLKKEQWRPALPDWDLMIKQL